MQASKQYTCKNETITENNPYTWHNSEERHLTYEEQGENMSWVMFEDNIITYAAPGVPDGVYTSEEVAIVPQILVGSEWIDNNDGYYTEHYIKLHKYETRTIARLKAQTEPEKQEGGLGSEHAAIFNKFANNLHQMKQHDDTASIPEPIEKGEDITRSIALIKSKPQRIHVIQVFVNWECSACGHENQAYYIEEDDLTGDQIETCKNCRMNNDVLLKNIYGHESN